MNSIVVSSTEAPKISISSPQVNTISITAPAQRVITGTINVGSAGTPGVGVIAGGTTGQSLVKASNIDYNMTWADRLASVQEDTSPHLGGNLDVQTHSITTDSTNQNINIVANGTGYINLDGAVKIKNQATPSVIEGGLYADTSGNIYFGDDTAWKKVLLEDGSVGADLITITTADGDVNTQEKIRISDGTNSDDVVIEAGTNMSISRSGDTITLTNTLSNTTLTQEEVEDYAGNLIDSSNSGEQTGITVTYQDATNDVDFVVDDQTLEVTDANADQSVVRLTLSNPTADDVVDVTAGTNVSFSGITAGGFTINSAATAPNVSLTDESSDTTCFPVFGTAATGAQALHTDASGLTYNSSTETLEVKNLKVNDASNPYTLPTADGSASEILSTDGSGTVSFTTISSTGLSDISDTAADAAGEILIWNDTTNEFVPNSITGGNNITVTNGDGTISVASDISNTTHLGDVDNSAADAAGEVLIWNNSTTKFVPNTLTAGTGISITNGDGSVTIANTVSDTNTNISTGDLTATGSHVYDLSGETQEIDVNGGEFKIDDLSHEYLRATGSNLTLQGLQYPSSDGTPGQAMTTNGSGVLSFSTFTDTNLGNTNQTLAANRTIDLDGNTLTFDGAVSGVAGIANDGAAEFRRRLTVKGYGAAPSLRINNADNTYGVNIQSPTLSADYTLVLPTTNGDADQVLTTNGNGVLSWEDGGGTDTNLGNSDQTLTGQRTVELGGNEIRFANSSTEVARIAPTGLIRATGRLVSQGTGTVGGTVRLNDADSTNFVGLMAPTTVSSNVEFILPGADGTDGQFLKTDGSANLSFADAKGFPKTLATLTGRFQFDADDGNRTILCGNSSFGTNYYLWNTELFNTVSSGTIDTTTQGISTINSGVSFKMPEAAKVRWDFQHRPINSSGYSLNYRAQIWSIASLPVSGSQVAWTLRSDTTFTSGSATTGWTTTTTTTTSEIPSGHYVLFCVGLDNESISAIAYLATQGNVTLVE